MRRYETYGNRHLVALCAVVLLGALAALGRHCPAQQPRLLDQRAYIMRLAMDLKGTRPTTEELSTPTAGLSALIDHYMETPEFYDRMMWLANDMFLTRTHFIEYFMRSYAYDNHATRYQVAKAVGEEPLRLFAYIVANDRPLTELVTADYTVANATLAWFWDIAYPGPAYGDAWLRARYNDGREHAGVLSQSSFYYRYPATPSNKHRGRANQITRIFLDDDHLLRDVAVDLRLGAVDPNLDLGEATLTNRGCVACHSSLDGIAAHLHGFALGPSRQETYARLNFGNFSFQGVERSHLILGRGPSYYGYPSRGLRDLGAYIADDPRFARTMAKHIYRFFMHRNLDYRDRDLLIDLAEILRAHNYSAKALIKHIVTDPLYRTVGVDGATQSASAPQRDGGEPEVSSVALAWQELSESITAMAAPAEQKQQLADFARFHAMAARESEALAAMQGATTRGVRSTAIHAFTAPSLSELVQPFKVATPEQLHTLGQWLVGETWDGNEGGQSEPRVFATLEYNTAVKVAAGGYDGGLVLERRWSVPPTYLLVLERWAEVMAQDIYNRELDASLPWGQRRVFKIVTGKENPREAEPMVRRQIAEWFTQFYAETVDPFGPEVSELYAFLLRGEAEARAQYGSWRSLQIAWQHLLELMLSDLRIALY